MKSTLSISLILPAYNEVKTIAKTIGDAKTFFEEKNYLYEIIVCADGDDGTRELVRELAQKDSTLKVLGSAQRRGKGYGIRQGVQMAQHSIIGFSDADNKTPISEFELFKPWLEEGYEVVIGSRGLRDSTIEKAQPLLRQWGSRAFGLVMHFIVGLNDIIDTQCGFKFFQRSVALDLFGCQKIDGYMFDVEILYLAKKKGYRIAEIPIRWRDDGDSRLNLFSGNLRNGWDLLKIRFGRSSSRASK